MTDSRVAEMDAESRALNDRLQARRAGTLPQPAPEPNGLPPVENPTYDLYSDAWERTQNTAERLAQAHADGFQAIQNKLKGLGVLTGNVDYDTYLNDEKAQLTKQSLEKNAQLSERYIPYVTDLMVPFAESLPYIETTLGSVAVGAGAGAAAGAVTGPLAPVAGVLGAAFGSTGLPWATTAAMDAGDIYTELRKQGATHEVAREVAIPAGIASGATWLLNTNMWSSAFTAAFKKAAVKHLAAGVVSPMLAKYAAMAGVGGVASLGQAATRDLAKTVADGIDDKYSAKVDWVKDLGEAFEQGFVGGGMTGITLDKAGHLVGNLSKAVGNLRDAVARHKQYQAAVQAAQAAGQPPPPRPAPPQPQPGNRPGARPAKRPATPFELINNQSAEATERAKIGAQGHDNRVTQADNELNAALTSGDRKRATLASRNAKLARAERDMFQAEETLRDPNVVGNDRWLARQKLADAKVALIDAGSIGAREEQLIDPTRIDLREKFGNSVQQLLRNWTDLARSYEQKFRLALQLDPEADRLAANFSLTKSRTRADQIEKFFNDMYKEIFTARLGMKWPQVEKRLLQAETRKISFSHDELANLTHDGKPRLGGPTEWSGTEDELIKLYNEIFHDTDSHLGHEIGNGYDLDVSHGNSLARKVQELVETNQERMAMAEASLEFYRRRAPYVNEYIRLQSGVDAELPEGYSGRLVRRGAKDLELDPTTRHGVNGFIAQGFERTSVKAPQPGVTLRRKPESKLPIEKNGQFSDARVTNRTLAQHMAFSDSGPVHRQVIENSTAKTRFRQVTGGNGLLELTKTHLNHITSGIPQAKHLAEQTLLATARAMYPIQLTGDVFQFVKQLTGCVNVAAHLRNPVNIVNGLVEYQRNPAFWDALFSRASDIEKRFEKAFAETATGLPSAKVRHDKSWFTQLLETPLVSGDKASIPLVGVPAYLDMRQRGFSHTKALDHALKVINLVSSTGNVEMLPTISRSPAAAFGTFMVQPQLVMSRLTDLWQDVGNFGLGQAGPVRAGKAWQDAIAGTIGVKLGIAAYAAVGTLAGVAVGKQLDQETVISHWIAQTLNGGFFDYPGLTDMMHAVTMSGINLVANEKQKRWELKTVPIQIVNDTAEFMFDVNQLLTNPETTITFGDAVAKWATGPNSIRLPGKAGQVQTWATLGLTGARVPAKPIKGIIDLQKATEVDTSL